MNLQTAFLVIMIGSAALSYPVAEAQPVHTFEQRWEPVYRMPPMIDASQGGAIKSPKLLDRHIPLPDPIPDVNVRTITIKKIDPTEELSPVEAPPPPMPRARPEEAAPTGAPLRRARVQKASLDLCQRHGMYKVHYGRTWRCRK